MKRGTGIQHEAVTMAGGVHGLLAAVIVLALPTSAAAESDELESHAELNPLLKDRIARDGQTTVYLCQNYVCGFPTADPAKFAEQLEAVSSEKN